MPNLTDSANRLEGQLNNIVGEIKKIREREQERQRQRERQGVKLDGDIGRQGIVQVQVHQSNQAGSPSPSPNPNTNTNPSSLKINNNTRQIQLIQNLQIQIKKIFQFISKMIDNTVQAHQKYNDLVQISNQAQNRYTKLYGIHQSNQKQSKFMAQYIKRISQDKIRMQKKCNQLQRMNKAQEQNIKFLKKIISDKELTLPNQKYKKDQDCLSVHHLMDDDQSDISKGSSMLSSNTAKRAPGLTKSAQGALGQKILPRGLNFKKKVIPQVQKNQDKQ